MHENSVAPGDYSGVKVARFQTWLDHPKRKITKKDIDLKQVFELGACMCGERTIAQALGISYKTLGEWLDEWPEFLRALLNGQSTTLQRLGKKQLDVAMQGHAGMLIWLGKQYLRQTDKAMVETRSEVNVMVSNAMAELDNIPKEQLLESLSILKAGVSDAVTISSEED